MRQAQKETVGLARGGEQYKGTGVSITPVVPTLAQAGIDKNLAKEGRKLGALSDSEFETVVAEARRAVTSADQFGAFSWTRNGGSGLIGKSLGAAGYPIGL